MPPDLEDMRLENAKCRTDDRLNEAAKVNTIGHPGGAGTGRQLEARLQSQQRPSARTGAAFDADDSLLARWAALRGGA